MKNTLLLIIYTLTSTVCLSQSLKLSYSSKKESQKTITDSLTKNNILFKNYNDLTEHNDSIISQLKKAGYINLLSNPIKKETDSSFNQVLDLGKKYGTIKIRTQSDLSEIDSLLEITLSRKHNKHYITPENLQTRINEIYRYLTKKGYPFTTIKTQKVKITESDTITIQLNVTTNKKRFIDHIKIKGYDNFPENFTKNLIAKKHLLNEKNIKKIQKTIEKLSFVETTKKPELLFKKDSTTLYMYLKKKNNNILDGLIGFNNTDGSKLEINGYLDLQLNNNLNNGEQLHIIYRGDDLDQTKLNINLNLPYLLKSNIGLTTNLNILRRDSTYQNTSFSGGLFYSFSPQIRSGISYKTTNSSTENNDTNSESYKSQNVKLDFNYESFSNDDLIIYKSRATAEIITGNRNTEEQQSKQFRINIEGEHNLQINSKNSLNIQGTVKFLNSDNIIFNELYQIGGTNSIRGFNQNSIDTSFFTAVNTEYRRRISNGIYLHTILDYGIFEEYLSKRVEKIYGIGVGTAILTQSGILRISFANGSFPGANLNFSNTIAHINLKILF
ncbi:hypothetical protein [Nonlabens sp.]|uniref:hypothetical protein n=1 Tax=Nonlabens sp. TaxID=1888209 RepID=UPI003F69D20A